jgi:hypothetical protein
MRPSAFFPAGPCDLGLCDGTPLAVSEESLSLVSGSCCADRMSGFEGGHLAPIRSSRPEGAHENNEGAHQKLGKNGIKPLQISEGAHFHEGAHAHISRRYACNKCDLSLFFDNSGSFVPDKYGGRHSENACYHGEMKVRKHFRWRFPKRGPVEGRNAKRFATKPCRTSRLS